MDDDTPPPEWWDTVAGAAAVVYVMFGLTFASWIGLVLDPSAPRSGATLAAAVGWVLALRHHGDVIAGQLDDIGRRLANLSETLTEARETLADRCAVLPHVTALFARWEAEAGPAGIGVKTPGMLLEEADAWDADGNHALARYLRSQANSYSDQPDDR